MRLRLTPSGLTMERVRSSAIAKSSQNWGENLQPTGPQTSRAVYLGISVRSNLGSAAATHRKYRFRKDFCQGPLDREALPAATFPFHIGVEEAESLVETLLH